MNLLIALIVLSVLILVHEFGHFIAARLNGIRVIEFAIFMGPKLFSIKGKETEYSVRLIPMGGFVKMEGEETVSSDSRAYSKKPVWRRFSVIFAGPFMNIVLAFLLIAIFTGNSGYLTNEVTELGEKSPLKVAGMVPGDQLLSWDGMNLFDAKTDLLMIQYGAKDGNVEVSYRRAADGQVVKTMVDTYRRPAVYRLGFAVQSDADGVATNTIDYVEPDSGLQLAGAQHGDTIIALNGTTVANRDDIVKWLNSDDNGANPVEVTVLRNGQTIVLSNVKPFVDAQFSLEAGFGYVEKPSFGQVMGASYDFSISTMRSIGKTLSWLFTGKVKFSQISGPVGIIGTINTVVEREPNFIDKLMSLFGLGALLSLNLGLMNLIPFPALDGSKLLLLIIEKVRRKPLPVEKEAMISLIGFALLMMVLVATLFNDIPKFILSKL